MSNTALQVNQTDIAGIFNEINHKLDKLINDKTNTIRPKILTIDESAKYLNISRSKLTMLQKDKLIDPPSKIGGNYFYEISYLDFFIEKNRPVTHQEISEAVSKTILGLNKRKSVF